MGLLSPVISPTREAPGADGVATNGTQVTEPVTRTGAGQHRQVHHGGQAAGWEMGHPASPM
ncbi:MAG: hypothetical protein DI592_24305 [Stenotrophomonas maltophilia]|nr:MAG: hypothetical protein DI592_24305 [Stenotrophomonas maltophilia]